MSGYDVVALADKGRNIWNASLGKIDVKEEILTVSGYFILLCTGYLNAQSVSAKTGAISARSIIGYIMIMVCLSIQMIGYGTYRAAHPLRVLIDQNTELDIIRSYFAYGRTDGNDGCLLSRKLQEILDE